MFPSGITEFQPHLYFRDNKNLFKVRRIDAEAWRAVFFGKEAQRKRSAEGEREKRAGLSGTVLPSEEANRIFRSVSTAARKTEIFLRGGDAAEGSDSIAGAPE